MFIPLLIYILIGIIWSCKHIKDIRKGFKIAIEKYGEPTTALSLFTLMLVILLWAPMEIYVQIMSRQIAKKKNDEESK